MFILIPFCGLAQANKGQTVSPDTAKQALQKFVPTGIRVGTDMIALFRTAATNNFSGYEVNADIDLYRYYLTFDYGNWSRNFPTVDTAYSNNGNYFRVGADVNFLLKDPDRNMFFIGIRYGRSVFSEDMVVQVGDSIWGITQQSYSNTAVKSRWFELTGGIKVKIWKMIWMGYTARFKFALKTGDTSTMLPHDVPGYGRTDKTSAWGFNYQLFVRLPVRRQK